MSTGLSVLSATYGIRATIVDVTTAVAALVKDGTLKFTVSPTTLNVDDPAPGQQKILNITYTINGGSSNTLTKNDNDLVSIDAPPATLASGLQIVKAEYGYSGNFTDVTDALQSQLNNGSINIVVGFKAVGIPDPNPNKQKELKVEYTINGKKSTDTLKDGKRFKVSAPPVEGKSNSTPSQDTGSFIGIIFASVARFFGTFLYATSVFAGIAFGDQFGSSLLFGALCFFIPGFAFWGLPILTFILRLFYSHDFITPIPQTAVAMPELPKMV
jgi:hypothetical protein